MSHISKVQILDSKKEWLLFFALIVAIFLVNLSLEYRSYSKLKSQKVVELKVKIINQYPKYNKNSKLYNVIKCKSDYGIFYSTIWGDIIDLKLRYITLKIITKSITFYEYLKGYFVPSFNHKVSDEYDIRYSIYKDIQLQHSSSFSSELYGALFFALPVSKESRGIYTNLGIAHLIAISGFHLGLISTILFFVLNPIYKFFQQHYFSYRNRFYDLSIIIIIFLFGYLYMLDFVPSLLRSFSMLLIGFYFVYRHIDIFHFKSLFIVIILLIAIFPKLLFSIGFILSVSGVFFIYLFMQYFKDYNKWIMALLFNIYIFIAMLPIVHFYFEAISVHQLLSPVITIFFSIFYPISLLAHIVGMGDIFDNFLELLKFIEFKVYYINTNIFELFIYGILATFAIKSRLAFILLNIFLLYFFIKFILILYN